MSDLEYFNLSNSIQEKIYELNEILRKERCQVCIGLVIADEENMMIAVPSSFDRNEKHILYSAISRIASEQSKCYVY